MAPVSIKLKAPLVGHSGPITEVEVRPPTAEDYFDLGDPTNVVRVPDGGFYVVENTAVVREYIKRCCSADPLLIEKASLADGIRIKEAVLGFFLEARDQTSPSGT